MRRGSIDSSSCTQEGEGIGLGRAWCADHLLVRELRHKYTNQRFRKRMRDHIIKLLKETFLIYTDDPWMLIDKD